MSKNLTFGRPGLQYPTDIHKESVAVQKATKMIVDNLFFLHKGVDELVAATGLGGQTIQQLVTQQITNTFTGGGGGGGGGGGASIIIRVGTHSIRLISYGTASDPVGSLFIETDRTSIYYVSDAMGPPAWVFGSGMMSAPIASRPTDLGTNDAGFTFFASDSITYFTWTGVAWAFGLLADHNHTSASGQGGPLTNDEHDGFSNYSGISTPATPAAGSCRIYSKTSAGHTQMFLLDQDGTDFQMLRDNILLIRNTTGGALTKGTAVDINGATGQIGNVRKAAANDPAKHCEGLLAEDIANNGFGLMIVEGYVSNVDTSAFSDGDVLYLSDTPGTYSTTPGTFVQSIGVVIYSHATQGIIWVSHDTMQAPMVTTSVAVTAQVAIIGSTNLTSIAGTYRLSYYLETTTADAAAGTIQLSIAFTDGAGATTDVSAALLLVALGRDSGDFFIHLASGSIAYQTILTGIFGTSQYALYIDLERLT